MKKNIITLVLVVRALRVISFFIILTSGFLTINLKDAWSDSEKESVITQYQRGQILYKEGNVEQAKYWWKQAAHQGHRDAQFKLGAVLYEEVFFEGDKGDVEQAKYWLEQAANQRHRLAQFY